MGLDDDRTLLLIEDEHSVLNSLRAYFEDMDYHVLAADNGRFGLELFQSKQPDVVMVDLHIPEVSGLDVLRRVRQEAPETPVLVISGSGVMNDVVQALRLGAWDYLLKPIQDLSVLRHATERAAERARLLRENRQYRQHLEEEIRKRTAELEAANQTLESKNLALREILATIEAEKKQVGQQVVSSVEKMVLPLLHAVRQGQPAARQKLVDQIEASLSEITSPFVNKLAKSVAGLSPTEIRISSLIRRGLSVKEVANLEGISVETVSAHRRSIRRKLGITNTKVNLTTYLDQVFAAEHAGNGA